MSLITWKNKTFPQHNNKNEKMYCCRHKINYTPYDINKQQPVMLDKQPQAIGTCIWH